MFHLLKDRDTLQEGNKVSNGMTCFLRLVHFVYQHSDNCTCMGPDLRQMRIQILAPALTGYLTFALLALNFPYWDVFVFVFFLGLHLWSKEVPESELKLQLLAYATAHDNARSLTH